MGEKIDRERDRLNGSHERFRKQYFVGVDLGQSHDPTAVCVVEKSVHSIEASNADPPRLGEASAVVENTYDVRHLERLKLGTSYVDVASQVARLMAREPLCSNRPRTKLAIDATGVGRPVADLMKRAGLKFDEVTITAGDGETSVGRAHRVSKLRLVSRLQALLHAGELRIAPTLADADVLVRELQDFKATISEASGYTSFNARVGAHDDLVLALAIACWQAEREDRNTARVFRFRV
ncbi:hypothetical protein BH23GEM10_BH23GEM10_17920 [soil metagenome]